MTATILEAFAAHGRAAGHSPRTVYTWATILARVFREFDPLTVSRAQLLAWLSDLVIVKGTRAHYRIVLRAFFAWLQAEDHRADNPAAGLPMVRGVTSVPKPASDAALRVALEHPDPNCQVIFTLAAFAGLRAAEIGTLRRDLVTEETITVVNGKGGKDAILPTHPAVWAVVRNLPPGPLVRPPRGGQPDGQWVSTTARRGLHRLGLTISVHQLRHWYATNLLRPKEYGGAGATMRTTQELMRHASIASTARYTAVSHAERVDAIAALVVA